MSLPSPNVLKSPAAVTIVWRASVAVYCPMTALVCSLKTVLLAVDIDSCSLATPVYREYVFLLLTKLT
jgi:hypothetical protein